MPADPWPHRTVLKTEAIDALVTRADGLYVDGTFGRGGHTRELLSRLDASARVLALDVDPAALATAAAIHDARLTVRHASFAELSGLLAPGSAAGVLLDLGVSSPQLDDASRGFSFRHDGPLDMRMDPTRGETAGQFLARADEALLTQVIRDHGEERFARAIAKALVARRQGGRAVRSTRELAEVVARAVRTREPGQDPATRTFQAVRIFINGELQALEQGLSAAIEVLQPGGRLAVIAFHSLEDRIVKRAIARESRAEPPDRRAPFAPPVRALRLKAIARIRPSAAEVAANPRARSAILRVAERLA